MEYVNQGSQPVNQQAERKVFSAKQKQNFAERRKALEVTVSQLERLVKGATFLHYQNLIEFVHCMRQKILVKKQGWVPQKYFKESPTNLFWVEGTPPCILYNYIPREFGRNVYHVAYTVPLVNLTRATMAMQWKHSEEIGNTARCQFVCEKSHVFTESDLVHTTDPLLEEKHWQKISFFANKY